MTQYAGILITVDGDVQKITWDDEDHTEHVREALSGVPAEVDGTGIMWCSIFSRDADIHGVGEVNPMATVLAQQYGNNGRVYSFGDVMLVSGATPEGEPIGYETESAEWLLKRLTCENGILDSITTILEKDPRLLASIQKLEDVRPEEEKEQAPQQ